MLQWCAFRKAYAFKLHEVCDNLNTGLIEFILSIVVQVFQGLAGRTAGQCVAVLSHAFWPLVPSQVSAESPDAAWSRKMRLEGKGTLKALRSSDEAQQ